MMRNAWKLSSMVKTIYHEVILQDHFPTSIYRESLGCEKVPRQEVTINICLASRFYDYNAIQED